MCLPQHGMEGFQNNWPCRIYKKRHIPGSQSFVPSYSKFWCNLYLQHCTCSGIYQRKDRWAIFCDGFLRFNNRYSSFRLVITIVFGSVVCWSNEMVVCIFNIETVSTNLEWRRYRATNSVYVMLEHFAVFTKLAKSVEVRSANLMTCWR